MRKLCAYLAGTLLAAASLTSCSSSQYAFRPNTPAYHGVASQAKTAPVAAPISAPDEQPAAETAVPQSATPTKQVAASPAKVEAPASRPLTKLNGLQRTAVAKVAKKLRQQPEVAKTEQAQSRAGTAGIFIGIGLVILLIGGLIGGTNIVATIGGVTFLVGLIMLIIALISGK